jgi:glutamate formiminotransferase
LELPCFLYGTGRSLPDVRRDAFRTIAPDTGPDRPHRSAGACAVGARPVLVAYNVWLDDRDLALARAVAARVRGPAVRALGLQVGDGVQVSMNLLAPDEVGPAEAYDKVAASARVERAELVGLLPRAVLLAVPASRWVQLDLSEERTIEARVGRSG